MLQEPIRASLLWEPEGGVLGLGMSQEVQAGYMK